MTAHAVLVESGLRSETRSFRTGTERIVLLLLTFGLLASFVAFVSSELATRSQLKSDEMLSTAVVKSQLYYIAHAIEVTLLVAAGLVGFASTDLKKIERGYLFRLVLLLAAVISMTTRGYTVSDLLSTRLVDNTGPFPFLLSTLAFIGARKNYWKFLSKLIPFSAALFACIAVVGMISLRSFTRLEAVATIGGTLTILYWPASWIVLVDRPRFSAGSVLRFFPILIYAIGSLFVQTRLNFVMIFALIGVYVYLQHRRNRRQAIGWILVVSITVWIGLLAATALTNTIAFEKVGDVAQAFVSRLDEDTRTGQLLYFAEDLRGIDLLLGRGSFATWNWAGVDWWGGTDVGYLTLLLYGGVPLLLAYITTHIAPGLRMLRTPRSSLQHTAAAMLLLWTIRMFSSEYPSYNVGYYIVLFSVGACISKDCFGQGSSRSL